MTRIVEARIWPIQAPLKHPIQVSFGEMHYRPGLLLSLTDENGLVGWGESWVNFPEWALWERTLTLFHLLRHVVGHPLSARGVPEFYQRYYLQAVQAGSIGAFSQAVSALECALWDLEAKRAKVPLWALLSGLNPLSTVEVPVYGSGIGPGNVVDRVTHAIDNGFKDVKIKVGFHEELDRSNFQAALGVAGVDHVMVDANQAWNRSDAQQEIAFYAANGARWIEEPISALDIHGYHELTQSFANIAAGENWYVSHANEVQGMALYVYQPDLCKIGGIWAARHMWSSGVTASHGTALHVLGLPICHTFALHAAAAWPHGISWVEMDTNENPLAKVLRIPWVVRQGKASFTGGVGLGVEVDEEQLSPFVVQELAPFCHILNGR